MNEQIIQIAARIRELREILEKTPEEVAAKVGITPEEYIRYENAEDDIPIGVLYAVAADFGVDPTVLMTGDGPRMDEYTIVRGGNGVRIERYASAAGLFGASLATSCGIDRFFQPGTLGITPSTGAPISISTSRLPPAPKALAGSNS